MIALKRKLIDQIIEVEGGYTCQVDDLGGPTKYGVTEIVARAHGYDGLMEDLPRALAFDVYVKAYWERVCADQMLDISELITEEVVDTGVNCGVYTASVFLQRCLNGFNKQGALYPNLVVDGKVGLRTITALDVYCKLRSEAVLHRLLNCLQGARYLELCESRERNETFLYGWVGKRVS
tara:strand:+ start:102 stop:638 length:537 start_codon:yes stop_codon:yes gene_type:complete